MKMKNVLLSLSLAGLCLHQASAQSPTHGTGAAARSIGDSSVESVESDLRPEQFRTQNSHLVSRASIMDYEMLAPTAAGYQSEYDTGTNSFGGSCATGSCGSFASAGGTKNWLTAESLLWFAQGRRSPALATTSAQGVLPVEDANGVTTEFGGPDGIVSGLLPGFRLSGGMYLGDCDKVAIGGRVFGIFSDDQQFNAASDGSTSLGVPFFNVAGQPDPFNDAYLVGFTTGGGAPVSDGELAARSDLDMVSAEASIYWLLGRSSNHRIDLVSGYTFSRLKNSIGLSTSSTNRFTGDTIPDGTIFRTEDLFATENVFNGGHLGVLSTVTRSRVSLSTLAKISFGNMRQSSAITGSTFQDDGVAPATFAGGIFAQQSNIGEITRDSFAFIPELGLKLGYSVRENLQLTVGYTFMMYSSVAMAGDQMDQVLDLTQVGGAAGVRPSPSFQDTSFWLQGIDLGLSWNY